MVFPFLKTLMYFYLQWTLAYIDQNIIKKKLCGCILAVSQPLTSSANRILLDLGLCVWTSFLVAYACHPSPCFHSISENNYFYINYKVTASSMCSRDRQPAVGCPGTSHFIFAQTQHGLPGTTRVTRTPASPSCQQPSQRQDPCVDMPGLLDSTGRFCKSCCSHFWQSERALTLLMTPRCPFSTSVCLQHQCIPRAFWRLIPC